MSLAAKVEYQDFKDSFSCISFKLQDKKLSDMFKLIAILETENNMTQNINYGCSNADNKPFLFNYKLDGRTILMIDFNKTNGEILVHEAIQFGFVHYRPHKDNLIFIEEVLTKAFAQKTFNDYADMVARINRENEQGKKKVSNYELEDDDYYE